MRSGTLVALKKVLPKVEREGFPITAIREIKVLKRLDHENIIRLLDVVYENCSAANSKLLVFMVFPFIKHDLVGVQHYRRNRLLVPEIKCIMLQLVRGLSYLHEHKVVHRDLKLANLLMDESGVLKIADFGLARVQTDQRRVDQTNRVVTRWYRSPELLLGETKYDTSVDMWSVGAIMGELVTGTPIFPGESEVHVLRYIFDTIGPPNEFVWPGFGRLPESAVVLAEVGSARKCLEAYLRDSTGVCRYESHHLLPVRMLVTDRHRNYSEREVFRFMFNGLSDHGVNVIGSMLRYNPVDRARAADIALNAFFQESPAVCRPEEIVLCPDARRELQVKENTFWKPMKSGQIPRRLSTATGYAINTNVRLSRKRTK